MADNRLPALLFAAGGSRSTRGAVIAGRDQTAGRPGTLLVFLIAGPLVFRLFGAPLG